MHHYNDRYFLASAALFFAFIMFVVLSVYGGQSTRGVVAFSAFCGLLSQYLAQSPRDPIVHAVAAGLGLSTALVAIIIFAFGY